jgi:hypothetical protein
MEACRYQESKFLMIKVGASGFSFDDWKGLSMIKNVRLPEILNT